jgi:hypothetical protein
MKNIKNICAFSTFVFLTIAASSAEASQPRTRMYGPLESVIDCTIKSPQSFKFSIDKDFSSSVIISDDFELTQDSRLPRDCVAKKINRFEDVYSSHMTQNIAPIFIAENDQTRRSFNYMNNVFPALKDNREIFESVFGNMQCLSQSYKFSVQGGFLYKQDFEDHDKFSSSIGVLTPYKIWLLINRDDGDQMALLIDNSKKTSISKTIVSIDHLSQETGKTFTITSDDPDMLFVKYKKLWPCSVSKA